MTERQGRADLHVHTADPGRLFFFENWTSEAHLARHNASAHLKDFRAPAADLFAAPPSVQTWRRIR